MKSIYRFSCFIIFIFSAIYVFNHEKYSQRIKIIDGYTVPFSVNQGEKISFYLNAQFEHKKGVVCIYNTKHQIVDSIILHLKPESLSNDTLLYEHGFSYSQKYSYSTSNLPSGLYYLGDAVPFLVKNTNVAQKVTVVFPYGNFMALNNIGGKSFAPDNSKNGIAATRLSLNRPSLFRNTPEYFLYWIDSIYGKNNVNYMSDLDLDHKENFANTKLLILYGYQSFWTMEGRKNLDSFIEQGGCMLAICNKLINNIYHYDANAQQIIFPDSSNANLNLQNNSPLLTWSSFYPNYQTVGCGYELECAEDVHFSNTKSFNIVELKHPIFKGINQTNIPLDTYEGNAVKVKFIDNYGIPQIDKTFYNFEKSNILAYDFWKAQNKNHVAGIFNFKKNEKSGDIIVIGSEQWIAPENLKRKEIAMITKNCIHYLDSSYAKK